MANGVHAFTFVCGTAAQGCNVQLGTTTNCLSCGDNCGAGFCTASGCSLHLDISHVGVATNLGVSFNGSGAPVANKTHVLTNGSLVRSDLLPDGRLSSGHGRLVSSDGHGDRTATLSFTQQGTWGYVVTGARTGDTAVPNPGFLVQSMNQALPSPPSTTAFVAVAGYGGPLSSASSFTWNIQNCWNSASAGVALKRAGD